VTIIEFGEVGRAAFSPARENQKSESGWKKQLSVDSYRVTRRAGTESPETGELVHEHRTRSIPLHLLRQCAVFVECEVESGTGWPSFWEPICSGNLYEKMDASLGMVAALSEVHAVRRASGPRVCGRARSDGLRYCMNP